MSKISQSGTVRSERKSKGYFLFELLISALMVAAIVVLAFPTYQDFSPEYNAVDHSVDDSVGAIHGDDPEESHQPAGQQPAGPENAAATEQAVVSGEEPGTS